MASPPELSSRVVAQTLDGHLLACGFAGETAVFASATGQVHSIGPETRSLAAHVDGTVVALFSKQGMLTGGEDGRIVRTSAACSSEVLGDEKGQWIDALAAAEDGSVAWSVGKTVTARSAKGEIRQMSAPSTARGLAFLPKGYRLVLSHYNGASLWFPNTKTEPEPLVWKGSHIDAAVSPDGRFVVTSMQENALHGWRVVDKAHMRMTGYPAKTRSMSWSHDGNWLATSGAEAAIIWPFAGKDGPMGKAPRECGVRPVRVSQVAFHPGALVLAIGYDDGFVMLVRLTDASELLVRAPKMAEDAKAITALAWDSAGKRLAIGAADGYSGILTLP
ncbi:MAG: WD40 repeat domain-containing protein [Beijerinckiaceae bacterium]